MQQPSPSEETAALLARLSQRPGVQSTLILARDSGAIVRSSGLITEQDEEQDGVTSAANGTYANGSNGEVSRKGTRKAEDVARLVWDFVTSAGGLVQELNGETDETRLLRLRTKKNELLIVPEGKYLLVVIHDTPPA